MSQQPAPPDADLILVMKRDCPTCTLVAPLVPALRGEHDALVLYSQDDPSFPDPSVTHDHDLTISHALEIEFVPTLIRRQNGAEVERAIGWNRTEWQRLTGIDDLGAELPEARPGCGALNVEPEHAERLAAATAAVGSRRVALGTQEDPIEACFAREWTDGLPVVPPTPERLERMLSGTSRSRADILGTLGPDLVDCTVEKAALNAVMAGCLPEYLPVVLAGVEAAATEEFNWHGLAATTHFAGPVMVVNGPVTRQLGINGELNALGQGNRANMTIGRAVNLTLRNVGGARPGGVDRATLGNPGKLSFCFAEREHDSPWESLATERGIPEGRSAVTLFAGEAPRGFIDQLSREPESLIQSLALALRATGHPKLVIGFDVMLVMSPEHTRVFRQAGWDKARVKRELHKALLSEGASLVRGAQGVAEGIPETMKDATVPKFRENGLWIVRAGSDAGFFSAIIGGWVSGPMGSESVTLEIRG